MDINRIIWIVLDSVGIGEAKDAAKFGDVGADTLGHTAKANGGLNIPNMVKLGIGNIDGAHNLEKCDNPIGCFGKLAEVSAGKEAECYFAVFFSGYDRYGDCKAHEPCQKYHSSSPCKLTPSIKKDYGGNQEWRNQVNVQSCCLTISLRQQLPAMWKQSMRC